MSRQLEPASREEEDAQLAEALAASLAQLELGGAAHVGEGQPPEPEPEPRGPGRAVVNITVAVHVGGASSSSSQPATAPARRAGAHSGLEP
eukprot:6119227-Lingulodinium_polyedra.AAC.1